MGALQSYGNNTACPSCVHVDPERLDLHIDPSLPRMHASILACYVTCHGGSTTVGSGDTRPAVPSSFLRFILRLICAYIRRIRHVRGPILQPFGNRASVGRCCMNMVTGSWCGIWVLTW
jgi:hypothetical protein